MVVVGVRFVCAMHACLLNASTCTVTMDCAETRRFSYSIHQRSCALSSSAGCDEGSRGACRRGARMPVRALMPPGQPRAERRCCGFPLLRLRSWISQGGLTALWRAVTTSVALTTVSGACPPFRPRRWQPRSLAAKSRSAGSPLAQSSTSELAPRRASTRTRDVRCAPSSAAVANQGV